MEQLVGEITLDKKRRLALGKVIKGKQVSSFEVYETEGGYFLKPKVSIPADEVWIFQNPVVKKSLARGLSQTPRHKLGSFARYAEEK
ncbi:MAG: hypothetical protein HYU99_07210 [Deltaproteobacteria bacterium]|nr:hypothetical protein [Deltaproteobacteria bacterium]